MHNNQTTAAGAYDAGAIYDALLPSGRFLTRDLSMSQSHNMNYAVNAITTVPAIITPGIELLSPSAYLDIPEMFRHATEHFGRHFRDTKTIKAYRRTWIKEVDLCAAAGRSALPMAVDTAIGIVCHFAWEAGSIALPSQARTVIAFVHKLAKLPDPTKDPDFLRFWSGIVNVIGTDHPNAKWAIIAAEFAQMVTAALDIGTPEAFEDACVLVALYEFALRRSELGDALVRDLFINDSVTLEVTRSKTRDCMEPVTIDEARSPVDARGLLRRWYEALGRERGPLFPHMHADGSFGDAPLSDHTLGRIVKRYAALIGLPPERIGAHSMRAGWATQAILDGKSDAETAAHLRHDSLDTLLEYYRPRAHRRLNLTKVSLGEAV